MTTAHNMRLNSPVEVKGSETEGLGIFATRKIACGEQIRKVNIVREITPSTPLLPAKGEKLEHCAYPDGKVVLYGYPDRHMNHSCDPNVFYDYFEPIPTTVALRDIEIGEELTVDYLINNPGGDSWKCSCGSKRCRGETGKSFFDLPPEFREEYYPLLAPWFKERYANQLAAVGLGT